MKDLMARGDPDAALDALEQIEVTPEVVDLEVAMFVYPRVVERLRHLMTIKGIAEFLIEKHLKDREGRQRVHGGTVFGLKDGGWVMAETDARSLLRFLTTYVGDDFTQEQLDKAIRLDPTRVEGSCPTHGAYETVVVCRECGEVTERLVVDHRGINAIEKVARKEIKEEIGKRRHRTDPSLVVTAQRA